jgi:acetolactate synthase I/II/III large subunit
VTTRNDEKKPKSGADIVVQTLEQRGVEYVFGVPGAKIDKIFDSLVDSKIKTACAGMSRTPLLLPEASGG